MKSYTHLLERIENKLENKIRDLKMEKLNFDLVKLKATETDVEIVFQTLGNRLFQGDGIGSVRLTEDDDEDEGSKQ